jgi:hypothetical protein
MRATPGNPATSWSTRTTSTTTPTPHTRRSRSTTPSSGASSNGRWHSPGGSPPNSGLSSRRPPRVGRLPARRPRDKPAPRRRSWASGGLGSARASARAAPRGARAIGGAGLEPRTLCVMPRGVSPWSLPPGGSGNESGPAERRESWTRSRDVRAFRDKSRCRQVDFRRMVQFPSLKTCRAQDFQSRAQFRVGLPEAAS